MCPRYPFQLYTPQFPIPGSTIFPVAFTLPIAELNHSISTPILLLLTLARLKLSTLGSKARIFDFGYSSAKYLTEIPLFAPKSTISGILEDLKI